MADTFFNSFDAVGNREDLTDIISNISPIDTPMLSRFGRVQASGIYHEWQNDSLATAVKTPVVEGVDPTFSGLTATTRSGNYCQIMNKTYRVSNTQEAVSKAGRASEYAYQAAKALKELARNMEMTIIDGTACSGGTTASARSLKGVRAWITTNTGAGSSGSGTGNSTLTSALLNTHLSTVWAQGGRPNALYVGSALKISISGFTTPMTRYEDAATKRYTATVNVFDSAFGPVDVVLDRYATATEILSLQDDLWKVAYLRPVYTKDLPDGGAGPKGMAETEFTLEARNEKGNGKMTAWV